MERILVGVDGSAPSLKAVDFAADLASKYDAELVLLTVAPHPSPEVDPAIQAYAHSEHIQGPASELALAMIESKLDDARRRAQVKAAKRISTEPVSATLPMKSLHPLRTVGPI
jgi:nucleotide-binding universal stress UspA family protein